MIGVRIGFCRSTLSNAEVDELYLLIDQLKAKLQAVEQERDTAIYQRDVLRALMPDLRSFVDVKGLTVGADVLIDRIDAALKDAP